MQRRRKPHSLARQDTNRASCFQHIKKFEKEGLIIHGLDIDTAGEIAGLGEPQHVDAGLDIDDTRRPRPHFLMQRET